MYVYMWYIYIYIYVIYVKYTNISCQMEQYGIDNIYWQNKKHEIFRDN